MDKNDGGPAFPSPCFTEPNGDYVWPKDGMSLRDYFAAKAMAAMTATGSDWAEIRASQAYKQADAMLKARGS